MRISLERIKEIVNVLEEKSRDKVEGEKMGAQPLLALGSFLDVAKKYRKEGIIDVEDILEKTNPLIEIYKKYLDTFEIRAPLFRRW